MRGKELPLNRRGIEAAQSEKKPGRFGSRTLGLSTLRLLSPTSRLFAPPLRDKTVHRPCQRRCGWWFCK
jgi:hypothetical protein